MIKLLSILFISLIIVGCNREENNERKALSHCADIKYIKNLNAYPEIVITKARRSGIMMELSDREKAIKQYKVDNNIDKSLMGPTELKSKLSNLADEINMKLYMLLNEVLAEASDIQALNEKTIDYKVEYKKDEFFYYAEFHLECWNEYKRDNGYYSKEFIDKYLEWQKQDVSNLGKQSYEFLNELLTITSYTRYSKELTEFFTKLMAILPTRN